MQGEVDDTGVAGEGDGRGEDDTMDAFRRRAVSEVVRQSASRWRIVAAWTSLRRSWDKRDGASPSSMGASDLGEEERAPSSPGVDTPTGEVCAGEGGSEAAVKPRKRVSLFLRRRGRFRDGMMAQSAYAAQAPARGEIESDVRFRRALSHFEKPVAMAESTAYVPGGEGGRYLQYESEIDRSEFEQLRRRTRKAFRKLRPASIRLAPVAEQKQAPPPKEESSEGEIIGEICLEDFADDGSEDFDFLDGQIVDVWTDGDDGDGRPSLRLDGQHLSLFGEEEFAAFVKEVGLQQLFEPPQPTEVEWDTFRVDDALLDQWRDDAKSHNELAGLWSHAKIGSDLRDMAALAVERFFVD